jgi:hypothetical protein
MFRLLLKLFRTGRPPGGRRGAGPGAGMNRVRPNVEALEDRLVLSPALLIPKLTDLLSSSSLRNQLRRFRGAVRVAVPDLSNMTFSLSSDGDATPNTGPFGGVIPGHHTLTILPFKPNTTATFNGLWDGMVPVSGQLHWDASQVSITCSWQDGSHYLSGHITTNPTDYLPGWYLDGQASGAPAYGHVFGSTSGPRIG